MLSDPAAGAASLAWTLDVTSAGLQAVDVPVAVAFKPQVPGKAIPPGAIITGVDAFRQYSGTATVATELCWGAPTGPCVPIVGRGIDTHAFDGRPASASLWLVHRVLGWGQDHPPLFVRGTVTVWYASPVGQ